VGMIGMTGERTSISGAEFDVHHESVRMGMFVDVSGILCVVCGLQHQPVGRGERRYIRYVGKIRPVNLLLQPIPPQTQITLASDDAIREGLCISSGADKVTLGKLMGSDIDVCLDPGYLTKHMAIVGKTGGGKSYTATVALEQMILHKNMTIIIIDRHGEFGALKDVPELSEFVVLQDSNSYAVPTIDDVYHEGKCTVISVNNISGDMMKEWVVQQIAHILFENRKVGNIGSFLLVLDEAHTWIPQRGGAICKDVLNSIVAEGRKFGIGVMMLTQRPAKLDKNAFSQCDSDVVLQLVNVNDLKAVGTSVEGVGKDELGQIQRLGVGEALVTGMGLRCPIFVKVNEKMSKDVNVGIVHGE